MDTSMTLVASEASQVSQDPKASEELSSSYQAATERFYRQQDRTTKNFGFGDSDEALAIAKTCYPRLAEAIKEELANHTFKSVSHNMDGFVRLLGMVSEELIALATISTALQDVIAEHPVQHTMQGIARVVSAEIFAEGLRRHDTALFERTEKWAREKHGNIQYRLQAARSIAKKAGFTPSASMTHKELTLMGSWCFNLMLKTLPELFEVQSREAGRYLCITEQAHGIAAAALTNFINRYPIFLPSVEKPTPWTGFNKGGPADPAAQKLAKLMRTRHKETKALVISAIRTGQMQPTLDALNAAQETPWRINGRVLDLIIECHNRGVKVKGAPPLKDYEAPGRLENWDTATEEARAFHIKKIDGIRTANRALANDRLKLVEDVETAKSLLDAPAFYTPCNIDWRGRVYPMTAFNFQREDRVRAMFLFADGEAIGEDGYKWLKIHLANCGDFGKVSKKSFDAREAWTDANLERIAAAAKDPFADLWWTKADKPFLFMAACFELVAAIEEGPGFITTVPVSWDGSCSGLQHLCAMTRAEEGALVNLTDQENPNDVYQTVADMAQKAIEAAAMRGEPYAAESLAYGVTRQVVKRNVMTYSYSSKKFGMAQQHMDDLMEPLKLEVLQGKRDKHPFGDEWVNHQNASRFLAKYVFAAIESVVQKPAQAMGFLQDLAKALAHEGLPLSWTTPVGLPWVNRYHELNVVQIRLWLHDKGISKPTRLNIPGEHKKDIEKKRAVNGVAPNFVHALDAAHLLLTILHAKAEGYRHFALVHDSFGCLANRAGRFHGIIREAFVKMYEDHDVLTEVLERATCDLNVNNLERLPNVVEPGTLDLKEVLNARYAFA